jgi:PAS domain S-box-containing protein
MFRLSREGVYLDYKAEKKDLVFQSAPIIGKTLREVTPPEFAEMYLKHIADALDTGQMQSFEYHLSIPGLGMRDYEARLVASGPDETTSIVRDITDRMQAEKALRESEERLRIAAQVAQIGTYVYEYAAGQGRFSPELVAFWGYQPDEVAIAGYNQLMSGLHPDDQKRIIENLAQANDPQGAGTLDLEFRVFHRNGSLRWLRVRGKTYFSGQGAERRPERAYGAVIDITRRKEVQVTLEQAVQEKGMLMKELQHRVKNSLNIAASLLYLEMDNLTDERSLAIFADVQARIRSMAAIYEQLYHEGQVDEIELSDYIRNLVDGLILSYAPDGRMRMETRLNPMQIDLKRALPLGLILNELITNALKYAFPPGTPGVIRVELYQDGAEMVLRVADNGVGIQDSTVSAGRMGLKLIEMLARQIHGSFGYENAGGLSAWVRF